VRPRAHAVLLGTRKGTVRPPHLASPSHGGLRGGRHCDTADHMGRGGGHAQVRCGMGAEPPADEGGCGVASAADVAPVARLAGVMQFIARAELMLGCDRQLVMPLATETGLLDALNARLPLALEPMASWTRTGKVKLPDGDVRRQHWWSSRVTQTKAAALLEAATGRDVPRLEAQRAGKAGGWLSAPPVADQGLCLPGAHYSTLLKRHLGVPLLPADCAGRVCPL